MPAIGQGTSIWDSATFRQQISLQESVVPVLFSVWLMALIVLTRAYTSVMTSQVVQPEYMKPPKTFEEIANSDFALAAFAWRNNFELDFQALNTTYAEVIEKKVTEFGFLDKDVSLNKYSSYLEFRI